MLTGEKQMTPEQVALVQESFAKVAPARANMAANEASTSEVNRTPLPAAPSRRSRCPRATSA